MTYWKAGLLLALFAACGIAHAQIIFLHGFEESCLIDTDGDRLVDCEEAIRSTLIGNPDTDDDGLSDGDEVLGTLGGLDLPAFGVDPRHKDILVEMDWDDDARNCSQHSHRPTAATIEEVKIFYAAIPLPNPDGKPGVNFIADFGQGGVFTGGNLVDFPNGVTSQLNQPFNDVKAANFATNRAGYFRYQAHAHFWADNDTSSGYGNVPSDDSVVTLNCYYDSSDHVRNTIIHELGHNLGLWHGGSHNCNGLPSYNSLMNYNHQFPGIDVNCQIGGDGIDNLGYSDGTRTTMVQGQLDEALGLCPPEHPLHSPIDWNGNGIVDAGFVSWSGVWSTSFDCSGLTTSVDHNDYAALILKPSSPPGGGAPTPAEGSGACAPVPEL